MRGGKKREEISHRYSTTFAVLPPWRGEEGGSKTLRVCKDKELRLKRRGREKGK